MTTPLRHVATLAALLLVAGCVDENRGSVAHVWSCRTDAGEPVSFSRRMSNREIRIWLDKTEILVSDDGRRWFNGELEHCAQVSA